MKELHNEGHQFGIYKVRRMMSELGLKAKAARRYKVTADSRHSLPVAATFLIVSSSMSISPTATIRPILTYVWTLEGYMYPSVVKIF